MSARALPAVSSRPSCGGTRSSVVPAGATSTGHDATNIGGVDGDGAAAYGEEGDVFAQSIMGYAGLTSKEGYSGIELSKEAQTLAAPPWPVTALASTRCWMP